MRLVAFALIMLPVVLQFNGGSPSNLYADDPSTQSATDTQPLLIRPLLRRIPELKSTHETTTSLPQPAILLQADPLKLDNETLRSPGKAILQKDVNLEPRTVSGGAGKLSQQLPSIDSFAKPFVIATGEPLKDAIVVSLPLIFSEPSEEAKADRGSKLAEVTDLGLARPTTVPVPQTENAKNPEPIQSLANNTKYLANQLISENLGSSEEITAPPPQVTLKVSTILARGDLRAAWLIFQDPVLQEMIGRVIEQNPGLQEAQARISQSRASLHRATADLFPQITANAQHGYRRFSQNGNAFIQDSTTTQGFDWYSSGFDTRWEIDLFGRLRSIRNAAGFEALAAEQSYRDVMVTLIGDLMLSYVEYSLAAERIRIAVQNLRVQAEILQLTEERFRLGEDGQLAVVQARTQVEVTRTTIPAFEEQRSVALHRLLLLQGLGSQAMNIPEHWGQRLPELPARVPGSIDCELLARRPDVRSSRLLVSAQLERLGASKAEYYPQVFLNGSISLETRDLDAWWDERSVAHNVGPMVSLNLLDFGRIRATVQGEKAKVEQAVARYRQSILDATEEVRNAMVGVERQRERADALSVAANSARSVVDMAKIEYREGVTNFQNVLDAQRQVLSIEDQHAVAYGTALVSYARLFKALGGAWYDSVDSINGPLISVPSSQP